MESGRSVPHASALKRPGPSSARISSVAAAVHPAPRPTASIPTVGGSAMEAATPIAPTVVAPPPPAVVAAPPPAVGTSASSPVTTAMLGEGRDRQANEYERSETCEKRLEQGGLPHMSTLHRNGGYMAGRANRLY